jgi:[ribosomal protein S18]-alanine N-acetyltransferase
VGVAEVPAAVASTWRVVPAAPEDTAALAGLGAQALVRGWSPESLARELEHPQAWAWTLREAADPARPQGLLVARRVLDELNILLVAVDPVRRRRGGGSALVRAALERARQETLLVAHLEVRASNDPAVALYRRHGFLAVGRRPRYYEGREDAVLMSLALAGGPAA